MTMSHRGLNLAQGETEIDHQEACVPEETIRDEKQGDRGLWLKNRDQVNFSA